MLDERRKAQLHKIFTLYIHAQPDYSKISITEHKFINFRQLNSSKFSVFSATALMAMAT